MNDAIVPRIGSLCTGYGGLDLAVLAALDAGEIVWVAENEPYVADLLAARVSAPNLGDITAVDWREVPRVDVITAGFPCQDISTAGKRVGIRKGNRSGLFYHVLDAIRVLRPALVVLENVAALRWKNGGFDKVLGHLAEAGYDTQWTSLRAGDIGAPHRRERLFVLAHARSSRRLPDWLRTGSSPSRESGSRPLRRGNSVPHSDQFGCRSHRLRSCPAEGARSPGEPARRGHTLPDADRQQSGQQRLAGWTTQAIPRHAGSALAAHPDGGGSDAGAAERAEFERDARSHRNSEQPAADTTGLRQPQEPGRNSANALRAGSGTGRRDDPGHDAAGADDLDRSTPIMDWGDYTTAIRRWELILGRPAPPPTELGRTGRPRLSPRFVEWMMGLPDGFVTDPALGLPRNAQLRALGNGVVPQQAAHAITLLIDEWVRHLEFAREASGPTETAA
ncbi:DNA cytosine methyltransferase [Amycolatopsis sacchari]|uniref:DNA cytosine methyltransferase n=1 Tax=Amycolatopsis sacchari TaxID=115433 RepID=UPI000AE7326F|nr:DNA cytosine methyltransferase [Amycolatopsis sacchari]